jgi:hypothetical protein
MKVPQETKKTTVILFCYTTLGIYPKECTSAYSRDTCISMF